MQPSFPEIYRAHAGRVFAQLTRLVGPVAERDDLRQQVFLNLHRAIPHFRGEATLGTLLHRIVANVACDHWRRSRRTTTPVADCDHDNEPADPGPSPETLARQRQEVARALEMLRLVKPKKRVAFVLVAVEGLSYEDAAARLGANVPATKQRVLAARRELAALLAPTSGQSVPVEGFPWKV